MKIKTRDFGEVEIREEDILTFRQPILGFEEYRRFILLFDPEIGPKFAWLQSVEEAGLCFMMMDPGNLREPYAPVLPDEVDKLLEGAGEYDCWVLLSVGSEFSRSTVNLRSPIVLCCSSRLAAQIVLDQPYPIRFPLVKEG